MVSFYYVFYNHIILLKCAIYTHPLLEEYSLIVEPQFSSQGIHFQDYTKDFFLNTHTKLRFLEILLCTSHKDISYNRFHKPFLPPLQRPLFPEYYPSIYQKNLLCLLHFHEYSYIYSMNKILSKPFHIHPKDNFFPVKQNPSLS